MKSTTAVNQRLLYGNIVALTVNALLFFALVLKLWLPFIWVIVVTQCLIGLIRLSWSIQ